MEWGDVVEKYLREMEISLEGVKRHLIIWDGGRAYVAALASGGLVLQ
jgi:hypothetical protein